MRRDNRGPRGTFGNRPPSPDNDGSGGQWTSGLPTSVVGKTNPKIDYVPQAGAPADRSGGTFEPNVDRGGQPYKPGPPVGQPRPFKVK